MYVAKCTDTCPGDVCLGTSLPGYRNPGDICPGKDTYPGGHLSGRPYFWVTFVLVKN